MPNIRKVESEKRRIIFRWKTLLPQTSEVDLILALNKSLQKARIPADTKFSRVRYLQSEVISTLFIEKSSAEQLVSNHSNILIRAAKIIDIDVIAVKPLEY